LRHNSKNLIIEALKDQQAVFGDDLFEKIESKKSVDSGVKTTFPPKEESPDEVMKVAEKTEVDLGNELFAEDFLKSESLGELFDKIKDCKNCGLGETRNKFVFGAGNPDADVLLIGEGPGAEEDKTGIPFVGKAGQLLTKILAAINFSRDEVYIANIVKCRPPGNRNPLPAEMEICKKYLHKQIDLIRPKLILCLGLVAANSLLNNKITLGSMRGNIYELNNIKVMVTYHPAALLRNPNWKRGAWEDVKKFKKLFDETVGV